MRTHSGAAKERRAKEQVAELFVYNGDERSKLNLPYDWIMNGSFFHIRT